MQKQDIELAKLVNGKRGNQMSRTYVLTYSDVGRSGVKERHVFKDFYSTKERAEKELRRMQRDPYYINPRIKKIV